MTFSLSSAYRYASGQRDLYVCMYVCMYADMHACTHAYVHSRLCVFFHVCVCLFICTLCIYASSFHSSLYTCSFDWSVYSYSFDCSVY